MKWRYSQHSARLFLGRAVLQPAMLPFCHGNSQGCPAPAHSAMLKAAPAPGSTSCQSLWWPCSSRCGQTSTQILTKVQGDAPCCGCPALGLLSSKAKGTQVSSDILGRIFQRGSFLPACGSQRWLIKPGELAHTQAF